MKNVYTLLYLLLFATTLLAQPTITESITPSIGYSQEVVFLETSNFDTGPSGANQTWDFSNIDVSNSLTLNFQILDPTTVIGASNFPDADFAWYIPAFEIYEFYAGNADSIYLLGGGNVNNMQIDFLTIFTNPEDGLHFPLTFGDSYNYSSVFDQYFSGNFLNSGDRTGSVQADAYGTITTPDGTFNDVLRIIITETSFGFTSTQYVWYDVNNFVPIFLYESSDDPDSPSSLYFSNPTISSDENILSKKVEWKAWFSQNENYIKIELPQLGKNKTIQLQLFNIEGKLLATTQLNQFEVNQNQVSLDLPSNISCETLILKLSSDNVISSKKISVCK